MYPVGVRRHMRGEIVGYFNGTEQVFCTECWPAQAVRGARPSLVLQSEDPDDPSGDFWVVDACQACGQQVKYKAATVLN